MRARIDFPLPEGGRLRGAFATALRVLRADTAGEVPAVLAAAEGESRAGRWAVGFVAYEAAAAFDAALDCHALPAGRPYALFAVYAGPDEPVAPAVAALPVIPAIPAMPATSSISATHATNRATNPGGFSCSSWRIATDAASAGADIATIREHVRAGDYYQVNLTTRLGADFSGDPASFFAALDESQPGAYGAFLDWGDGQVLSVSPELFFARAPGASGGRITTRPMKGTAPRFADAASDRAAADALRASAKEQAENLMIVDLLRNDLARIAAIGSVRVERLFEVEAWPSVWQMSSTIAATLRVEVGLADIFAALFPCGSVTGAPKVAAMRAIRALEPWPRGVYCGAIGVLCPDGRAIFSVAIRSVELWGGDAVCGIGSGITADSQASAEYAEWLAKRRFLLRASASFDLVETMRCEHGEFSRRASHLARLAASAEHFGFALDRATVSAALDELAGKVSVGGTAQRVRLLLSRDGGVRCESFALEDDLREVIVRLAATPIASDSEFVRHKTTERTAYAFFANPPPGVFDTLLWNERGELTEFTRGNLVIERDGEWLTPAASCGLLPGVLREELLAQGRLREAIVRREDLASADRLWFINSLRGMIPARLVAG